MKKTTFKIQLYQGRVQEYRYQHDEIWIEIGELFKNNGVEDYSISFFKSFL